MQHRRELADLMGACWRLICACAGGRGIDAWFELEDLRFRVARCVEAREVMAGDMFGDGEEFLSVAELEQRLTRLKTLCDMYHQGTGEAVGNSPRRNRIVAEQLRARLRNTRLRRARLIDHIEATGRGEDGEERDRQGRVEGR